MTASMAGEDSNAYDNACDHACNQADDHEDDQPDGNAIVLVITCKRTFFESPLIFWIVNTMIKFFLD